MKEDKSTADDIASHQMSSLKQQRESKNEQARKEKLLKKLHEVKCELRELIDSRIQLDREIKTSH